MVSDLDFISLWDTFRDTNDEANFSLNGLEDGVCGERRRDINHGSVRLDFSDSLNVVEECHLDKACFWLAVWPLDKETDLLHVGEDR